MRTTPLTLRSSQRRGFSAVEIIAVATIIGILALILIPILTKQVDKSRGTSVQDEMGQIARFITLTHAETSHYFRLQDYDNTNTYNAPNGPIPNIEDPTTEVPVTYFSLTPIANGFPSLSVQERAKLSKIWNGPHTVFHNSATIRDLNQSFTAALCKLTPPLGTLNNTPAQVGPIHVNVSGTIENPGELAPTAPLDEQMDKYPLDPWGNPYFFFPPGVVQVPGSVTSETFLNPTPVLYSMGPDGLPGSIAPSSSVAYYPAPIGVLGTDGTDDVVWKF